MWCIGRCAAHPLMLPLADALLVACMMRSLVATVVVALEVQFTAAVLRVYGVWCAGCGTAFHYQCQAGTASDVSYNMMRSQVAPCTGYLYCRL